MRVLKRGGSLVAGVLLLATLVFPTTFSSPVIDGAISGDWSGDEWILDDSNTDSPWQGNEVDDVYLTWDADNLYLAIRHSLNNNGIVLYLDAGTGAADGSADVSGLDAWPRNIQFSGFTAEFQYGKWNEQGGNFYHILNGTTTDDLTAQVEIATAGANGETELRIPWNTLYGLGAGAVPAGASLKLVATMVGGDDTGAHDSAPDNASVPPADVFGATLLDNFYVITVDQDSDGLPDSGVSPGMGAGVSWNPLTPNPNEFVTITITNTTQGGVLHWGVNGIDGEGWQQPLQSYWPAGTVAANDVAVETPLDGPNANNIATVTLGPFTDARQVVRSIDFVIRWDDGTWDNNNNTDYRIITDLTPQPGDATLEFTEPADSAVVTGPITVTVTASGETSVEMRADTVLIHSGSTPPYTTTWDPAGTDYGTVFLQARAQAANGRYTMAWRRITYEPVVSHEPAPAGIKRGATDNGDGTVTFALFAPGKSFVTIKGDWNNWDPNAEVMNHDDALNLWWKTVNTGNGVQKYQYVIEGKKSLADPYSRDVDWTVDGQENGLYQNAKSVIDVGAAPFVWSDGDYVAPPHNKWVIYETHVGDFSETGDFEGMRAKLSYLAELGINAIELMPPYEFPGGQSWGYNPAFHMAVESVYGTPDQFKALVNDAHNLGIAIIIDMVFNHMDASAPLYQLYENDFAASPWFHDQTNPWGFPDMDHWSTDTHDYTRDVVEFWINEYHVDGFRYDATAFIGWDTNGNGVASFTQAARNAKADIYNMAEHLPQETALVQQTETDAEWHDTFHDQMKANLREGQFEGSFYPDLDRTAQAIHYNGDGFATASEVINYTESHDEQRVIWEAQTNPNIDYNAAVQKSRLGATVLFTSAGVPMLYHGQEFGEDTEKTIEPNPLHWVHLDEPTGSALHRHYQRMIWLFNNHASLSSDFLNTDLKDYDKNVIVYRREQGTDKIVVAANFSNQPQTLDIPVPDNGTWFEYVDDTQFSASGGVIANVTIPASKALVFVNNKDWGGGANQPPTAVASADPTSGTAPLDVQFTGSNSSDADGTISSYAWDFGDGGTASTADPLYTYTSAGTYQAVLTVTDDLGATDTDTVTVTVNAAGNQPPSATIISPPAGAVLALNSTINIAGDASDPEDGAVPAANFVWTADLPNGQVDYPVGSGTKTVSTTTSLPGTYTLRLKVTDSQGLDDVQTVVFEVAAGAANVAPVAYFTASKTSGPAPLAVSFNSSLSTDPDGSISSRSWDFGDGTSSTLVSPSHTFQSAGTYTVVLTVTDNDGATGTSSTTITVTGGGGGGNQPPTAVASATPTSGDAPLAVQFTGSNSTDSDGSITSYAWDFGDGGTSSVADPAYTYNSAGTFNARLIVTDDGGLQDTAFVTITVTQPNQPPTATITQPADGATFTVGQSVAFAGEGTDPEDGTLPASAFTWTSIAPDGVERPLASGVKSGSGTPTVPGNYTIRLKVEDSGGLTDIAEVQITVQPSAKIAADLETAAGGFSLAEIPDGYELSGAYPNPFTLSMGATRIRFALMTPERVTLRIYDVLGREIIALLQGADMGAGYHTLRWNGRDRSGNLVPSGVYLIHISAGPLQAVRKLMLRR